MASDMGPARGHQPFRFRTAEGLRRKAEAVGLDRDDAAGQRNGVQQGRAEARLKTQGLQPRLAMSPGNP